MSKLPLTATTLLATLSTTVDRAGEVITIKGPTIGRTFSSIPTEEKTLPIVTGWYGSNQRFQQTVRLIDPSGTLIAQQTEWVALGSNWGVYTVTPLTIAVAQSGIHTLEVLAKGELKLRQDIGLVSTDYVPEATQLHQPRITSFVIARYVTGLNTESYYDIELHEVMTGKGYSVHSLTSFVILIGWSQVGKPFDAVLSFLASNGQEIPFTVQVTPNLYKVCTHTYVTIKVQPETFVRGGIYWLTIRYEGEAVRFPIKLNSLKEAT